MDKETQTIKASKVGKLDLKKLFDLSKSIKVSSTATVLNKPGAQLLSDYPLLTYAPSQHGPGIRTEDNGTLVEDIAVAACETPDYEILAQRFGTTAKHISDALAYASKVKFVSEKKD